MWKDHSELQKGLSVDVDPTPCSAEVNTWPPSRVQGMQLIPLSLTHSLTVPSSQLW